MYQWLKCYNICDNVITMKLKLRKIGNSLGVILPAKVVKCYNIGDEIEVNVITLEKNVITSNPNVITSDSPDSSATPVDTRPLKQTQTRWWCNKHKSWNLKCGCK